MREWLAFPFILFILTNDRLIKIIGLFKMAGDSPDIVALFVINALYPPDLPLKS